MRLTRNPLIASFLPPGVSQALAVANGASKLIKAAKGGDHRARARLRAAAATGSPAMLEGLRVAAAATGTRLRFSGLASAGKEAAEQAADSEQAEG